MCFVLLGYTDRQNKPTNGFCLILNPLADILGQVVRYHLFYCQSFHGGGRLQPHQYSFVWFQLLVCPFFEFFFQDGLVHIYDLQSGQWISGFQAAAGAKISHILWSCGFGYYGYSILFLISFDCYNIQIQLMVSLSIHSCLWLPLHQGIEDFKFLMMAMRICFWEVFQVTYAIL